MQKKAYYVTINNIRYAKGMVVMVHIKTYVNKLSKYEKIKYLVILLLAITVLLIGIPTLARIKNKTALETATTWDGSVSTTFHSGTGIENDPYIISSGAELAFLATELLTRDFENNYIELSNDIILNEGTITYDNVNGITYVLNNNRYYVPEYGNKYYSDITKTGAEVGVINIFPSLNGFKGHFNAKSYSIYGAYITSDIAEEVALFTNFSGTINDLYLENALVYGGIITGGVVGKGTNASLTNVLFNGHVIGKNITDDTVLNIPVTSDVINVTNIPTDTNIFLNNDLSFVGRITSSTTLTGTCTITGSDATIMINDIPISCDGFTIDLGINPLDTITVTTSTTSLEPVTLNFNNLAYNISSKYGVSGAIIAMGNNLNLKHIVNKGVVTSYFLSGGLIGTTTGVLNLTESYNKGKVKGLNNSGGLIGSIEKSTSSITIDKVYNSGTVEGISSAGLINSVINNPNSLTISNSFDASLNKSIANVNNSSININNVYHLNESFIDTEITGIPSLTTMEYLTDKNNLIPMFPEFISLEDMATNNANIWLYNNYSLPILFIDDVNEPIVNIHAGTYSWNNINMELTEKIFSNNITFSIEDVDNLTPVKEKYYYVHNSKTPLTLTEINNITDWTFYTDVETINTEGSYIIYVKAIDCNDNILYLNTDILTVDASGSSISIALGENSWNSLRTSLNYLTVDNAITLNINASDLLSGIKSVSYYISNSLLNDETISAITDWIPYENTITISDLGTYIVYVKAIDNTNHTTFVNTDYIIYDGYTMSSLIIGRNSTSYENTNNITGKSTVSLNFDYESQAHSLDNFTHNLATNKALPLNTKITLLDKVNNKIYEYQVTNETTNYPFTLFKEIGTSNDKNYSETSYYNDGMIREHFTIIIDLSLTDVTTNYLDVKCYIELKDANNIVVRPTLNSTIKTFNIYNRVNYASTDATTNISSGYNSRILFNSNSSTDIILENSLNYKTINDTPIIDTRYENKDFGLTIKLVDSNGNIMGNEYLKNLIFKVNNHDYYPEDDNIIRISLNTGIVNNTKTLTVITKTNDNNFTEGTYYLKINNYLADNSHYYTELSNSVITVPMLVTNSAKVSTNYSFDVIVDNSYKIVSKENNTVNTSFSILQSSLYNPSIRVSLYQKASLTPYNQDYNLIDLQDYVSDTLNMVSENIYYVSENPIRWNGLDTTYNNFELNLIPANFENTGYKYVFDLYSGNKKMGTIEKYFIVK